MPVYVYHCDNCGIQFEEYQRFSDDPLTVCPECGVEKLHKVITAPVSVIYKGSGFYSTDHRSNSGASSARSLKDNSDKKESTEKTSKAENSKEKSST